MQVKPFDKRIYLASPTMHGEEQMYVKEAFDTNWVSTVGANLNALESEIGDLLGIEGTVALSSGTSALHLALKLVGVKPGNIVFGQSLTFDASVNPIMYEHCTPVFIDSETDTWNMDPVALEKAFEKYPNCKAVICVNLYGTPCKLDEIRKMPVDEARKALMSIKGVGPKVAECALLYGMYRVECFPVDVWIKRVMEQFYPKGFPEFAKEYAGIAQQYLFHYMRTGI